MGRCLVVAVVLGVACGAVACAGPLSDGEVAFRKGWYPEAKQAFAGLEDESRSWDEAQRAEYALYRGLTLAALGDRGAAAAWLREAKALEDAHPGALLAEDARRLAVASDENALP
jgi:hypothetical protein